MANNDTSVKLTITGDANPLAVELSRAEKDLKDLGAIGKSIKVLEGAEDNVRRFEGELQAAQIKARALQTALSEAYSADADAPLLRKLNTELAAAERAANKAEAALNKSQAAVVRLNLEAGKTGVSTSNLAQSSKALAAETSKVSANIDSLKSKITAAANAEDVLAARTRAMSSAFGTLNIRSAEKIKADIAAIDQALIKLASNSSLSGAEFNRAFAAGKNQIAKLNAELSGLNLAKTKQSVDGLSGAFSSLKGVLGGIGIAAVGEKFLSANLAADKLQKSLNAVNGDAVKSASDLEFLKETAQRLGINLESSSNGFIKLAAAAKGTALEGQATRDIFTGIGGAMAQLGLSSSDTERAFTAVTQMMSKGTVSAEELKGQLGDILPGALQMAARSTSLTTQELGKLMETGGLLAEDFLPKFAAEVQKSFGGSTGEVKGLSNTIERLKNTWSELLATIGQGGGLSLLGAAAGIVNSALVVLATTLGVVINGIVGLAESVGVVAGAFATWDFSHVSEGLAAIGARMDKTNKHLAEISNRTLGASDGLNKTGSAAKDAGDAASESSPGWQKLVVVYDQAAKSAADYVEQVKKTAKANNDQADVLVNLAQHSGNENSLLIAKDAAARQAATSADSLAQALDREAKTLQAKVIALQEEIKGLNDVSAEKLKAIEDAKKLAEAKGEEARAALSGADASRVAAAAAEAEAAAHNDNSRNINELKLAYEQAAIKVDVLRAAQASGVNVTAELIVAQTAAAKASALYNDAMKDQIEKLNALNRQKVAQLNLDTSGINLAIAQQKSIQQTARLRGDEYGAMVAGNNIKRLEIQLMEITAKVKAAEAQAIIESTKLLREDLRARGELTAAKEAELRVAELGAQAKITESKIISETVKQLKEIADATDLYGKASVSAAEKTKTFSDSLDEIGAKADGAAGKLSHLKEVQNDLTGSNGTLGDGWAGNRGGGVTGEQYFNYEINKRTDAETAALAMQKIGAEVNSRLLKGEFNTPGGSRGAQIGAIEKVIAEAGAELAAKRNTGTADTAQSAARATTATPAAQTVNINLGGRTTSVSMSSTQDANALTSVLRQLETDLARAA